MRRREFITLLGGAAAAWPLAARAQQPDRMRRIGVLTTLAASDTVAQAWVAAFREGLQKLGWTEGRNVADRLSLGGRPIRSRCSDSRTELVALQPDLDSSHDTPTTAPLLQATRAPFPIVFANVADPVGSGFVASLAAAGRQRHRLHHALSRRCAGKWLELLKEIAPRVARVAFCSTRPRRHTAEITWTASKPPLRLRPGARSSARSPRRRLSCDPSLPRRHASRMAVLIVMPDAFLIAHRAQIASLGGSLPSPCRLSVPCLHRSRRPDVLRD